VTLYKKRKSFAKNIGKITVNPVKNSMMTFQADKLTPLTSLLRFYQWAGVDVACQEDPVDRFVKPQTQTVETIQAQPLSPATMAKEPTAPTVAPIAAAAAISEAWTQAKQATTLAMLRENLGAYEGCALKRTAKNTCFADGTAGSPLMLIGEAPGRDEDIQGLPFVGRSGQLLNRILAAIGLERTQVYIANVIPWRPPGNRTPTPMEIELCRPFIDRQIELAAPKILVALGGPAAKFLTGEGQGILKSRGRWLTHKTAGGIIIPVMPTLHPAYLLRTPSHKKFVWQDFLQIKKRLEALNQE